MNVTNPIVSSHSPLSPSQLTVRKRPEPVPLTSAATLQFLESKKKDTQNSIAKLRSIKPSAACKEYEFIQMKVSQLIDRLLIDKITDREAQNVALCKEELKEVEKKLKGMQRRKDTKQSFRLFKGILVYLDS